MLTKYVLEQLSGCQGSEDTEDEEKDAQGVINLSNFRYDFPRNMVLKHF